MPAAKEKATAVEKMNSQESLEVKASEEEEEEEEAEEIEEEEEEVEEEEELKKRFGLTTDRKLCE
eukprot:12247812-Karenia_brevis.AAC.1